MKILTIILLVYILAPYVASALFLLYALGRSIYCWAYWNWMV